jgi:secreted trypsin-like serine protease
MTTQTAGTLPCRKPGKEIVREVLCTLLFFIGISVSIGMGRAQSSARPNLERPSAPQIIGGTLADPGEYPWQVALVRAWRTNPYEGMFCGGSLIDPSWVLTAAHCIYPGGELMNPADLEVVLGVVKLSDGPQSGSLGQRIAVERICPHPGYEHASLQNDLALLRLNFPAVLGTMVQTVACAGPSDSSLFAPLTDATVTGWGKVDTYHYPDDLYEVTLPIVSNPVCATVMGALISGMLCAGPAAGGKDSCNGDSGGPLVVPNGSGSWLLAGIVSWGTTPCAQPNRYGVYTRVSTYSAWIRSHLGPFVYLPVLRK